MSHAAAVRFLLCAALCAASASAQAQTVDAALRARFGFLGPEIHKLTWQIGLLSTAPIDGDRAAALVYNPRRGRIDILRLEDGELTGDTLGTRGEISGLAAGDVDGDGAADVLMFTDRGRLRIEVRGAGAAPVPAIEVGPPAARGSHVLRSGDLDGDGRVDAVVITRDGMRVVTDLAATPHVSAADPLLANEVRAMHLFDADGDGALDVVVGTADEAMGVWLRRGRGDGTFGPWIVLPVRKLRTVFPGPAGGGSPTLVTIEDAQGRVVEYRLRRRQDRVRPSVELTTLPAGTRGRARPFAQLDADGDGDLDVVVADPERARLIYLLEQEGAFHVRPVPALAGIDSLAVSDLDGDGRTDLLMTSAEERALAWKPGARPLDAFPERLPSTGEPLAAAAGADGIVLLARDDRRRATLWRIDRTEDGGFGEPDELVELGRLSSNPLRLLIADLAPQPGPEVAYVEPGRGLKVLFRGEDGRLRPPGDDEGPDVLQVEDGAVTLTEHGGEPALLVTRERFARVLRFDDDGEPVVLAQDNGPQGAEALALGLVLPGEARAYLDRKAGKLWVAPREGAPIAVDVPGTGITHLLSQRDDLLLIGGSGIARVPFAGTSWELDRLRVHEPLNEDSVYYAGLAADLDGDGAREVAIADADVHGLHVLVAEGDELRRALTFPVFEQPESSSRSAEPRELAAADFDGDGLQDLMLVCHDRVLLYLQEE